MARTLLVASSMSAKLLTAALFSGAIMAGAPVASAQVESSAMTEESRGPAPSAQAPAQAALAPDQAPTPPLPPRSNGTLFGVGVAATVTGGVALPVGGMLAFVHLLNGLGDAMTCAAQVGQPEPACASSSDATGAVAAVLVVSGIALLATGIPMIVVGGKRAPKDVAFDSVLVRF